MKLYQEISAIIVSKTDPTSKEINTVLNITGCMEAFDWTKRNEQFVKFVLFFVHAYSFDSTMMDVKNYSASLEIIQKHFGFYFEKFKTSFDETFNEKYQELISFYLEVQKNREFELLVTGTILYKQMLSSCTSDSIKKKGKDDDDLHIDYESKKKIFDSCLDINNELKMLENNLYNKNKLIEEVAKSMETSDIRPEEIKIQKKS